MIKFYVVGKRNCNGITPHLLAETQTGELLELSPKTGNKIFRRSWRTIKELVDIDGYEILDPRNVYLTGRFFDYLVETYSELIATTI